MSEVRILKFSTSNANGFVSVSPDPLDLDFTEEGNAIPFFYLNTNYNENFITVDLTFFAEYYIDDGFGGLSLVDTLPVINVSPLFNLAVFNINTSKVSNTTIRLTATHSNIFDDELFKFVLDDGSVVTQSPLFTGFKALVEYDLPTEAEVEFEYPFSVTANLESTVSSFDTSNLSANQYAVWFYPISINNVIRLIGEGKV